MVFLTSVLGPQIFLSIYTKLFITLFLTNLVSFHVSPFNTHHICTHSHANSAILPVVPQNAICLLSSTHMYMLGLLPSPPCEILFILRPQFQHHFSDFSTSFIHYIDDICKTHTKYAMNNSDGGDAGEY